MNAVPHQSDLLSINYLEGNDQVSYTFYITKYPELSLVLGRWDSKTNEFVTVAKFNKQLEFPIKDYCYQEPIILGDLEQFTLFAGTSITNAGISTIKGDIGVSPGVSITGFPIEGDIVIPGTLQQGSLHRNDIISLAVKTVLNNLYNNIAGRVRCSQALHGNIGGMVLDAGIYSSIVGMSITSGDLILDGNGDPDGIFIFQMKTTFYNAVGCNIILINDANPENIFWQIGSTASLATSTIMYGNIMVFAGITIAAGVTIIGRVFSINGTIACNSNKINQNGLTILLENFIFQEQIIMGDNIKRFVLFASTYITNAGISHINGDVGVSPGSAINGFVSPGIIRVPGSINGDVHNGNDNVAVLAKTELIELYNDVASRVSSDSYPLSGNIGGMTLEPGLYTSLTGITITTGNLVLDGKGNPNGMFIFQMLTTLSTAAGCNVILINDANPENIFWQIGSTASLAAGCTMYGILMAYSSITIAAGVTINGHVYTLTGAITSTTNKID